MRLLAPLALASALLTLLPVAVADHEPACIDVTGSYASTTGRYLTVRFETNEFPGWQGQACKDLDGVVIPADSGSATFDLWCPIGPSLCIL